MKSDSANGEPTFETLYSRLLAYVDARIQNGEFSERSLAKRMGISQPHFHHVRSGKRKLQKDLADTILERFQITILDLLTLAELTSVADRLKSGAIGFTHYPAVDSHDPDNSKREGRFRLLPRHPSKLKRGPPKFDAS